MGRFLYVAVFVALLAGCVPIERAPARAEFGVSIVRPDVGAAAPSKTETARLAAKADQICTQGYTMTRVEVEQAEAGQQLVDMKLRCKYYDRVDLDDIHMNWSNLL